MGIHGPNTIAAVRDTMFAEATNANLSYAAANGTAWGAPYPVTFNGLYYAFGAYGGSGATLGLIIAIFIFSKAKEQKSIAKLSFAPGLFNINEMVIFGLPISKYNNWVFSNISYEDYTTSSIWSALDNTRTISTILRNWGKYYGISNRINLFSS